jgi:hypothetical protein
MVSDPVKLENLCRVCRKKRQGAAASMSAAAVDSTFSAARRGRIGLGDAGRSDSAWKT